MHLRVNSSNLEELKSSLNGSENGSVVSVTPSEPPLASPSAIDTFNNLAFADTPEKVPVLSGTHFTTPQHRSSALSPTSSLPNLSPILESPSILRPGNNNGVKVRTADLYESSLNDGDFITANNLNNSNAVAGCDDGHSDSHHQTYADPWIPRNDRRFSSEEDIQIPHRRAEIQTTVIGLTALSGGRKPFPVKRYEMRIADMDVATSPVEDIVNKNLSRVKGRKEKKGSERYSYLQAVSPLENHN